MFYIYRSTRVVAARDNHNNNNKRYLFDDEA